ncbi:MAG: UbiD family decarboxylase [Alphaproteobacteria bacterium]|nr:UbiD family decarboxylase [Alphaproteobacteria bacterium]
MNDTSAARNPAAALAPTPDQGPSAGQPSLRSWLDQLDAAGELRRITAKVDWDEEIGAIARVNLSLGGPALLFERIKGYEHARCTQFFTCGVGEKRKVALMLGLPPESTEKALVQHLKDTYRDPIEPVTVSGGPVKDVVLTGKEINLWEFPTPRWHASDGGRFIDTFCGVITHDMETDRANIGLYRGQVLSKRKVGKLLIPTQGWGTHFGKYKDAKNRMPVAIAHGWHDALPFCAGSPFPKHICEWDMIGAIIGQPVELVDCETVPLQVPATAEIVVEGWIDPDPASFQMEGPFADYPGYLGGKPSPKPVLKVTAVTHRHNPILRGALEGARPGFPSEDSPLCAFSWSAIAWNMLEDAGVAGVTDVWMPPVSTGTNIVVQIRKRYRGHAMQVAHALWGTGSGQWFFKNVMVVEEDIDIRDPQALDWAMAFRVNAGRGDVAIIGPTFGSVLDPSTLPADRDVPKYGTGKWHRVLIDATRSWEHEPKAEFGGHRYPPLNKIRPKLERKLKKRWAKYGIGIDYLDDEARELLTMEQLSKRLPEV